MADVEEGLKEAEKTTWDYVPRHAWLCMVLGLLSPCIAGFAMLIEDQHAKPLVWVFAGVLYLICVVEGLCFNRVSKYLRNVMSDQDFKQHMEKVIKAKPRIRYHIENYHIVTETVVRPGSTPRKVRKRINTHAASRDYQIRSSLDETLSPMQMCAMFQLLSDPGLSDARLSEKASQTKGFLLLCHMPLQLHPISEADKMDYQDDKKSFFEREKCDENCDTREDWTLTCSKPEDLLVILSGTEDSCSKPWWMNRGVLILTSLCCVSAVFRYMMYSRCRCHDWPVVKHFSHRKDVDFNEEVPISSRQHRSDPASLAFKKAPREGYINKPGSTPSNKAPKAAWAEPLAPLVRRSQPLELSMAPPSYWKFQDIENGFHEKVELASDEAAMFQDVLDQTFKQNATQERTDGEMPTGLKVHCVIRMEDSKMWQRYAAKRAEIGEFDFNLLEHLPGSGAAKTEGPMSAIVRKSGPVREVNEMFLFQGSAPAGALGIGETGFDMGKASKNVGTMFGAGAYMAEASSKSDENARTDGSGDFEGMYALLLCRTVLGNMFYIDESDIPAIEAALKGGAHHSVLGDREAKVATYREFVVFDEAQLYPEYIIIYKRCC